MYVFGLEMILMDERIHWRYISGRISEDKIFIKKDKQSVMIFKIYMIRLPSTIFKKNMSIMSSDVFFCLKIILFDKTINWRCRSRRNSEDHKEGQTMHHDISELYTNTWPINDIDQ